MIRAFIIVLLFFAVIYVAWWYGAPIIAHRNTYIAHQTYGYGVTHATQLLRLESNYEDLQGKIDKSHDQAAISAYTSEQKADIKQMKLTIALMHASDVPQSVRVFMEGR